MADGSNSQMVITNKFRPSRARNTTAGSARPTGSNRAPHGDRIGMRHMLDTTRKGHEKEAQGTRSPRRIRLSRKRGCRKPRHAVTVARPTRWGNPWLVGKHGDQATCVQAHADWLAGKRHDAPNGASAKEVLARIGELRGRDLACWCGLDGPCHADTLLRLANQGGQ